MSVPTLIQDIFHRQFNKFDNFNFHNPVNINSSFNRHLDLNNPVHINDLLNWNLHLNHSLNDFLLWGSIVIGFIQILWLMVVSHRLLRLSDVKLGFGLSWLSNVELRLLEILSWHFTIQLAWDKWPVDFSIASHSVIINVILSLNIDWDLFDNLFDNLYLFYHLNSLDDHFFDYFLDFNMQRDLDQLNDLSDLCFIFMNQTLNRYFN